MLVTSEKEERASTPWRVICPRHGAVFLTHDEYEAQLEAVDRDWCCPVFDTGNPEDPLDVGPGICGTPSEWDDSWYDSWTDKVANEDTAKIVEPPQGCLACNLEEQDKIRALLDKHGVRVEKVPTPSHAWRDVVVCPNCGQAWLMMPREESSTPS